MKAMQGCRVKDEQRPRNSFSGLFGVVSTQTAEPARESRERLNVRLHAAMHASTLGDKRSDR